MYGSALAGEDLAAAAGFAPWHAALCFAIHFSGEARAVSGRIARSFRRQTRTRTATNELMAVGRAR